jgi:hypothetical protein
MSTKGPRFDPEADAGRFINGLERSPNSVIPTIPLPPADPAVLGPARVAASAVADSAGVGPALGRAQRTVAEWVLGRYQRAGFQSAYLSSWLDDPAQRLEVVDAVVDAATAFILWDLLPEEAFSALWARFAAFHDARLLSERSDHL